jgi:glycosyltransferase involved in cell wall biosynthesis
MGAFYAFCDRALAIGSANAAFYRAMGVPENRIFLAPYTVDNDRFMAMAKLPPQERLAVRERLGIKATSPAILYAGKFTQRKHPDHLLQAAARLRDQTEQPFTVVMCGAGEMEAELRAYCEEHPSLDVIFAGFVNQAELPKLYAACDIFSLPSESEPWGLTVNEAMCAGLPVVVSREVGSVADLVVDGLNGFTPEAGDIDALTTALKRLVEDASFRQRAAKASFDRISNWGYRETADGLRAAINSLASRTS